MTRNLLCDIYILLILEVSALIYINKFIAAFLLPPGILIVLMLLLNFWLYKKKVSGAKVLSLLIAIFYLLTTSFVSDGLVRSLESRYTTLPEVSGDVIILLGGGALMDTPDIDGTGSAANRLLTAARLQKKLNIPIIASGGKVFADTGTEAVIAKRILLGLGIPENKILIEDKSLNTTQNALFTREIVEKQHFAKPILVTSAFHMPRAVKNFHKAGLEVTAFPADYKANRISAVTVFKFLPNSGAFNDTCTALWEYAGMLALEVGKAVSGE
jgi:uncharacterized SAM-binding protein YcdF (DUF218 family)